MRERTDVRILSDKSFTMDHEDETSRMADRSIRPRNPWFLTRDFSLVWWSQVLSQVADGVSKLALLWFVYSITGSALKTTVIGLLQTLPPIVLGPVIGVVVDRYQEDHPDLQRPGQGLLDRLDPLLGIRGIVYDTSALRADISLRDCHRHVHPHALIVCTAHGEEGTIDRRQCPSSRHHEPRHCHRPGRQRTGDCLLRFTGRALYQCGDLSGVHRRFLSAYRPA